VPPGSIIVGGCLGPSAPATSRARKGWTVAAGELTAIAKQRPDLILMDIQLPIMDGYTATNQIKADPALRSIPIIAVTSYALASEETKARAAGCDDYVTKPFSPRQLLAKIRSICLNRSQSIAALHNVCVWHLADIQLSPGNVCFRR
jgi:CheY-like chemotaxis protein